MKRWGQFAVAVLALVVGLGTVLYAQLWVSSGSGVSTIGTMTVSGATALNGGLTMDTSTFTVANTTGNVATTGTLTVNNAGPHTMSAGSSGGVEFKVRNTTSGTSAYTGFRLGNNSSVDRFGAFSFSEGYSTSGSQIADGMTLFSSGVGGLQLSAFDAVGSVRVYTGGGTLRMTIDNLGNIVLAQGAVSNAGRYESAALQPGFLAYNSSSDANVATGSTIDFDTEAYDDAASFLNDSFTATVAGRYHFCVQVVGTDASNWVGAANLVTNTRTYQLGSGQATATVGEFMGGCVHADMDAADSASVTLTSTVTVDSIAGGGTPVLTYFSGRLVP